MLMQSNCESMKLQGRLGVVVGEVHFTSDLQLVMDLMTKKVHNYGQ